MLGTKPVTIIWAWACLPGFRALRLEHFWKIWENVNFLEGFIWVEERVQNAYGGRVLMSKFDGEALSIARPQNTVRCNIYSLV